MRFNKKRLLILCAAILLNGAEAQAKVTKAVLNVAPADYRGGCPAVIKFTGSITVNGPTIVKYIFTRSDGAIDTITKTLSFTAAGSKSVAETWTLGGEPLPYYKGWEAIKVLGTPAILSNQADFTVRCNPPLNSAIAAHGNTDWHLNTANEFLFGVDMNGNSTAPNHAPNSWNKRHIHVGLTNTSNYYYDKTRVATGDDYNVANGIDTAMLFFYAGHGNPTEWCSLGDMATQSKMKLSNVTDSLGWSRYYWQCSCEVFAHGPKVCSGSSLDYACPGSFSGAADSDAMRNVFERWGPALTSDLRMACGVSTLAYCHSGNVNHIWDDFNNQGMSVAQSFIDGLSGAGVVPLCITMGGSDITKTPLYDTTFTNQPNTSGSSHYHIMYLGGTASRWILPFVVVPIPVALPKFHISPPEPPERLRMLDLRAGQTAVTTFAVFAGGKAQARHEAASGAIYLHSVARPTAAEQVIEERLYPQRAAALLHELGWDTKELSEPLVTPILTASMPADGSSGDVRKGQDSVLVTYQRLIDVDGQKIPVIGDGGQVRVSLSNGGSIVNASRVWRDLQAPSATVKIKTFEQARDEALKQLGAAEAYKLDQWRWGYKELAGAVKQDDLQVVFQFAFVPKDSQDLLQHPPQIVEVSGEAN
jgi:hypothetical protein